MKGILKFSLPEESEEFEAAVKGSFYKSQVDEIWDVFFRPRHKHGYKDTIINDLLGADIAEENETEVHKSCSLLMDRLEMIYKENFTET